MYLWTRLWGRYHVPQNVFLVLSKLAMSAILHGATNPLLRGLGQLADRSTYLRVNLPTAKSTRQRVKTDGSSSKCCCRKASFAVSDDDSVRTTTASCMHCGTTMRPTVARHPASCTSEAACSVHDVENCATLMHSELHNCRVCLVLNISLLFSWKLRLVVFNVA